MSYTLKLDWEDERIEAVNKALYNAYHRLGPHPSVYTPRETAELGSALYDIQVYRDAVEQVKASIAWETAEQHVSSESCPSCGCLEAGKWGATGVMPADHHWHWLNADHTSGYLAHGELVS